ncbi:hypothetical protein JOF53_000542 [Crossiella equi]|uniref:DUF2716 domain-containing protein n=1 Tax=Crossiella equi TaxID=130796 RepID=A0ABS5A7J6_9PSEU|nr:DUF2716 domain-containing protein [Crossiella equi]MBP2471670.1 hypothetical protein [Crossiella equi]
MTSPSEPLGPIVPERLPVGAVVVQDGPVRRTHFGTHARIDHGPLPAHGLAELVRRQVGECARRGEPVEWLVRSAELGEHLLAAGFRVGWSRSALIADPALFTDGTRGWRHTWLAEPVQDWLAARPGPHRAPLAELYADGLAPFWEVDLRVVDQDGGWAVRTEGFVAIGGLTAVRPELLTTWANWACQSNRLLYAEASGPLREQLLAAGFTDAGPVCSYHWTPPGTPATTRPVRELLNDPEYRTLWDTVHERLAFRPHPRCFPGITEPPGAVTWNLGAGEADTLQEVLERGLRSVGEPGERLHWLDWNHIGYGFDPDLCGGEGQPEWPGAVYPDGDYYLYLPSDLRFGTFGHPWEATLCVWGTGLVAAVEKELTALLGEPVRRAEVPEVVERWQETARWNLTPATWPVSGQNPPELEKSLLAAGFRRDGDLYRWEPPGSPRAELPLRVVTAQAELDRVWTEVDGRLDFRPSMTEFPGITEPQGAATWSFDGAEAARAVLVRGLRAVALAGEPMYRLDWQHAVHRFAPRRLSDSDWPGLAAPRGDFYFQVTPDLRLGTFEHPWERTLCVWGTALVPLVEAELTALLGEPLRRAG